MEGVYPIWWLRIAGLNHRFAVGGLEQSLRRIVSALSDHTPPGGQRPAQPATGPAGPARAGRRGACVLTGSRQSAASAQVGTSDSAA
jgi:hypothetical protein